MPSDSPKERMLAEIMRRRAELPARERPEAAQWDAAFDAVVEKYSSKTGAISATIDLSEGSFDPLKIRVQRLVLDLSKAELIGLVWNEFIARIGVRTNGEEVLDAYLQMIGYNDGSGVVDWGTRLGLVNNLPRGEKHRFLWLGGQLESDVETVLRNALRDAYNKTEGLAFTLSMIEEAKGQASHPLQAYAAHLLDHGVEKRRAGALGDIEQDGSIGLKQSETALLIGVDPNGRQPAWWRGEGSLITVGPPGSGKTRGHVFPNLASWPGSAVVLDVKGECFAQTAELRKRFGRVIRFDPWEPALSARYNPLQAIGRDKYDIWEDCRAVAEAIVGAPSASANENPFFRQSAANILTLCLAYACWTENPSKPVGIAEVIELTSSIGMDEGLPLAKLCPSDPEPGEEPDYPVEMVQTAMQLLRLTSKQRETFNNVAATLDSMMGPLMGGRIRDVMSGSDWTPKDLRTPGTTLYLCVPDDQIGRLGPVLRLLIGQHVSGLMGRDGGDASSQVLFFLDEVAQLGRMDPLVKALEVGRGHGVRLWLLIQSLSQLRDPRAYGREGADTIMENCRLKAFMNPGPDQAEELSRWLGQKTDAFSEKDKRAVTPQELSGPEWAHQLLAILPGEKPYRLNKCRWME